MTTSVPSQADYHAEELRKAFAKLKGDQSDALSLLRSVSAELAVCPAVGTEHRLYNDWETIREDYRKAVEATRRNASKCASLLSQHTLMLPRILEPDVHMNDKKVIVYLFIEEANKGQNTADTNMRTFESIGDRINNFVEDFKKHTSSLWTRFWCNLKNLCTQAFNFMKRVANWIRILFSSIDLSHSAASYQRARIRIRCDEKVRRLEEEDPHSLEDSAREVESNCGELKDILGSIGASWNDISMSCLELVTIFERAEGALDKNTFVLLEEQVKQAKIIHDPLIEGLREYGSNRTATF